MKVSLLFLLVTCILSTRVSAKVFIKTTLPNDLSADDIAAIGAAGADWFLGQDEERNLRGQQDRRELGTWCQLECQGWPCGQCFVWLHECWGNWCTESRSFNEEEATGLSTPPRTREIYTAECVEKIDEALVIMEGAVSADGEPIVDASHFSCYEQIDVDEPQSCQGFSYWTMWDAVEDEVSIQNFQDNPSICQSQMQDSNLEAVVDITCDVDTVAFVITSDDPGSSSSDDPGSSSSGDPGSSYSYSRTERFYQYLLYGNIGDNMLRNRYSFPVGDYTVTATAFLKDGSSTKASLTFKVNDC